ncbi:MAG: energy-coupling factor transporter transmembrane component T, partial [bacterium]
LIPSIFFGNLFNSISLVIKVISTVMLFNVFSYTTKNQEITKAVKVFGVPDLLILTVDISIKFVTIIGDVAINILNYLKIRSIGRNKKKRHSIQNILGFLFIKSRNYSEDIYSSMLCRGFNGHYRTRNKKNVMQKIDYVYIAVNALLLTGVFIWRH